MMNKNLNKMLRFYHDNIQAMHDTPDEVVLDKKFAQEFIRDGAITIIRDRVIDEDPFFETRSIYRLHPDIVRRYNDPKFKEQNNIICR